jgi:hypothetical protein
MPRKSKMKFQRVGIKTKPFASTWTWPLGLFCIIGIIVFVGIFSIKDKKEICIRNESIVSDTTTYCLHVSDSLKNYPIYVLTEYSWIRLQ